MTPAPLQLRQAPSELALNSASFTPLAFANARWYASRSRANASSGPTIPPRAGASGEISPQPTAFFTSATILASSAAVNSFSAKETGHMLPSSRFASSLKPNVAYLDLNFDAGVK